MPYLCRGGCRPQKPGPRLRHRMYARHGRPHQLHARDQRPPHGARAHALRPPERLSAMCQERQVRTSGLSYPLRHPHQPVRRPRPRSVQLPDRGFPLHHPRHEQVRHVPSLRNDVQRDADRGCSFRHRARFPGSGLHRLQPAPRSLTLYLLRPVRRRLSRGCSYRG